MAKFVTTNGRLSINAVDLSTHVKTMSLKRGASLQEASAMGDLDEKALAGLRNGTLDVTFLNDFATGSVDATLFGLVGAAPFAVAVRPVNATVSVTNPEFQFNALLADDDIPFDHGQVAMRTVSFKVDGAVTRATV